MSDCQACAAPTPDAFLCGLCATQLRGWLRALAEGPYIRAVGGRTRSGREWYIERRTPGLLAALHDVVLGRVKLGDGGVRKRGDDIRAPFDPVTENGRRTRQGEAATLLDAADELLAEITRQVCRSRGIPTPRVDAAGAAAFLAANTAAITMVEAAGEWHRRVEGFVRRIERVIDRPVARRWLGRCPTWLEDERRACGVDLFAPEDAVEVWCRQCRHSHNANRLRLLLMNDLERERLTFDMILRANRLQPPEFQIPERTLRHWRQTGRLKARGWLRPCSCGHPHCHHRRNLSCRDCDCVGFDGREVVSQHGVDDEPLYLWADVRKLRAEKPRRKVG